MYSVYIYICSKPFLLTHVKIQHCDRGVSARACCVRYMDMCIGEYHSIAWHDWVCLIRSFPIGFFFSSQFGFDFELVASSDVYLCVRGESVCVHWMSVSARGTTTFHIEYIVKSNRLRLCISLHIFHLLSFAPFDNIIEFLAIDQQFQKLGKKNRIHNFEQTIKVES